MAMCSTGSSSAAQKVFRSLVVLFSLIRSGAAQIHSFQSYPIPKPPASVFPVNVFFVYGTEDNPPGFFLLGHQKPSVTFEQLKLRNTSDSYGSVDVALISGSDWKKYFSHLTGRELCCHPDVKFRPPGLCPDPNRLARPTENPMYYNVRPGNFENPGLAPLPLNHTDTYVLIISNCGNELEGLIDGTVIVRNAYGYLPGLEFPKLVFYCWMIIGYLFIFLVWTSLLVIHRKRIIHFHYCIEGVIFLGLLECTVQFAHYMDWNNYGSRSSALLIMSILTTVVKNIFSYMLVLVASLGWGVTKPTLERPVIFKIQAVVLLYIILDSVRQVTEDFIYSPNLPIAQFFLVILCLIPISVLNGVIFYWIFSSLTDLLEVLEEQKQYEKLQIFKRLLAVLIAALVLFTIALFVQIYAAASDVKSRWEVHWWLIDGVPHLLFALVLVVMMCLWKPNEHSRKLAYLEELPDDDEMDEVNSKIGGEDRVHVWGAELDLGANTSDEDSDDLEKSFDIPTHHSYPKEAVRSTEAI